MASYIINLAAKYAAAFGAMYIGDLPYRTAVVSHEDNEYNVELYPKYDTEIEKMAFEFDEKRLEFGDVLLINDNAYLAPPPVMTFDRRKNLITTQVSGSDAQVVERWGTDPWSVTIIMLLIDLENRIYPSERIRQITEMFEYNGPVLVEGMLFEEKGIDSIYFESIKIDPLKDFPGDTFQIVLDAKSIKEIFYTLEKPNE